MIYLVTRHPGALQWMQRLLPGKAAKAMTHLAPDFAPSRGDLVLGVLPPRWVERIARAGAQAWVLEVDLPVEMRGRELTAADLDKQKARLVRYDARAIEQWR